MIERIGREIELGDFEPSRHVWRGSRARHGGGVKALD